VPATGCARSAADHDPAGGPPGVGSGRNRSPRHRRGAPDGDGAGDPATPAGPAGPAGPAAAGYSVDQLQHNMLTAVGVFDEILAGLDPKTQAAAVTAATEARTRLRDAFDEVSRHHAAFDGVVPRGRDDPPT